jgi:hypothetical protein
MRRIGKATWKQALLRLQFRLLDPGGDSGSGRFGQLELDRPLRLSLHYHRTSQDLVAMRDVAHPQIHKVAPAQLAVDRQVEHRQISNLMGVLKLNSNCPDVLRLQRWFLPDQLAFVLRFPVLRGLHDRLLRR